MGSLSQRVTVSITQLSVLKVKSKWTEILGVSKKRGHEEEPRRKSYGFTESLGLLTWRLRPSPQDPVHPPYTRQV